MMDSCAEIKRWNRPKRNFEFGYELSSTTQISPKNASSSCISVLTFDDSINVMNEFKSSNSNAFAMKENELQGNIVNMNGIVEPFPTSQPDKMENEELISLTMLEDQCDNPGGTTKETTQFQEELTNKGSLYSRITTGYVGKSQGDLGTQSEFQEINSESGDRNKNYDKNDKFVNSNFKEKRAEVNRIMEEEDERGNSAKSNGIICSNSCETKRIQGIAIVSEPRPKICSSLLMNDNERNQTDQWREVHDHRTGKVYFYNRRTRESRWSLPPNAILLSEKRRINFKEQDTPSNSPRKVPITMESIKSEERSQEGTRHLIDCDGCCEIGETRHEGEQETATVIEGYKQPSTQSQSERKRKFIYPTDCEMQSNIFKIHTNETCYFVEENDDIQEDKLQRIPVENCGEDKFLFCILCGMKVQSTFHLIEHMSTYCSSLEHCTKRNDICNVFYDTFVTVNALFNRTGAHDNSEQSKSQDNKENLQHMESRGNDEEELGFDAENYEQIFSASDDEDTIMDYSLNQSLNNSFHKNSSYHRKEHEEEASPMISTCPFCSKSFQGGSNLSRHLLRCNARQNSNIKRTKQYNYQCNQRI